MARLGAEAGAADASEEYKAFLRCLPLWFRARFPILPWTLEARRRSLSAVVGGDCAINKLRSVQGWDMNKSYEAASGRSWRCCMAVLLMCAPLAVMAGEVTPSGMSDADTADQFIVKYRDGTPAKSDDSALQQTLDVAASTIVSRNASLQRGVGLRLGKRSRLALGADVIRSNRQLNRVEAEALMHQLAEDPNVEYVEIDGQAELLATVNDTYFSEQWAYSDAVNGINAARAWDISTGAGEVVAVIDTGVTSHPDLDANLLPGYNFVSPGADNNYVDERGPNASDPGIPCPTKQARWHGTLVSGIVAAVTNNGMGIAGTAPGAKVVPVRVFLNEFSTNGQCTGRTFARISTVSDAIVWVSGAGDVGGVPRNPYPAKVVNLSLGSIGGCNKTYQNAIDQAGAVGAIVVAAAGNDGIDPKGFAPASCNGVVAVGAVNASSIRADFSNFGAYVDIAAPGEGILSTDNSGVFVPGNAKYSSKSGTSIAAPMVSGVLALMRSVAPNLSSRELVSILKRTARPFPGQMSEPLGSGIVDAYAAVNEARYRQAMQRRSVTSLPSIISIVMDD